MHITQATTIQHLEGILHLQQRYLKGYSSAEEMSSQGFLTVAHNLDLLRRMNTLHKHIIAIDKEEVVGYALSMDPSLRMELPLLKPMFQRLNTIRFKGQILSQSSYYIMGQICIAKPYRGTGLFHKLYLEHRRYYSAKFDYLITEVSDSNPRSLRAHEKTGFQSIAKYRDTTDLWHLILWDWKTDP